jgi:hypothetical protein
VLLERLGSRLGNAHVSSKNRPFACVCCADFRLDSGVYLRYGFVGNLEQQRYQDKADTRGEVRASANDKPCCTKKTQLK